MDRLNKFGGEYLKHGSGVLDVAGEKGQLPIELAVMGQTLRLVVDCRPTVEKMRNKCSRKNRLSE